MNTSTTTQPFRILVVDDNPAIHEDYRKILCAQRQGSDLAEVESALFGESAPEPKATRFELDSAFQGLEGIAKVDQAVAEGRPYAMAFVDVRMPPGLDGVETVGRIWGKHPDLQVVICTAHADYSWEQIVQKLGESDNLLILKKPFDNVEVLQIAHALTKKWELTRAAAARLSDLDEAVQARTAELTSTNERLLAEGRRRADAEQAAIESDQRFHRAFQSAAVAMALLNAETHAYIDVNQSFIGLAGRARDELIGNTSKGLGMLVDPSDCDHIVAELGAGRGVRNFPCRIRRKDDDVRETLLSADIAEVGLEKCLLLVMHDVTDQHRLEVQLRQAQKMDAIGQLAAGVAHDFNNLLTIIRGHASLMLARGDLVPQVGSSLEQIRTAADRAGALTRQLLAFSRKQVVQRRVLNLNNVIDRVHGMLVRLIGETITLEQNCEAQLPRIFADEASMEQVIMNLVVNARDAMPDGGRLRLATTQLSLDELAGRANPEARPGLFVCLSVADTGQGMDTAVLARIFEPFFTTKQTGKGTGLGLSTVYGIVKQHEGWIEVMSRPGEGSTFRVFLPVTDKRVEGTSDTTFLPSSVELFTGKETVLVVEDEQALREYVKATLAQHGYDVLEAADGPSALHVWQTARRPVHLLLTDMVMPNGLSGSQLASRLTRKSDQLKVLFTSGYSPELAGSEVSLVDGVNFLPKPYEPVKLLKTVRRVLDAELANAPRG